MGFAGQCAGGRGPGLAWMGGHRCSQQAHMAGPAALARCRCSAPSGVHGGLGAAAGTGFQAKYGAPAQASPHLQAEGPTSAAPERHTARPPSSPAKMLTHKVCIRTRARRRSERQSNNEPPELSKASSARPRPAKEHGNQPAGFSNREGYKALYPQRIFRLTSQS